MKGKKDKWTYIIERNCRVYSVSILSYEHRFCADKLDYVDQPFIIFHTTVKMENSICQSSYLGLKIIFSWSHMWNVMATKQYMRITRTYIWGAQIHTSCLSFSLGSGFNLTVWRFLLVGLIITQFINRQSVSASKFNVNLIFQ